MDKSGEEANALDGGGGGGGGEDKERERWNIMRKLERRRQEEERGKEGREAAPQGGPKRALTQPLPALPEPRRHTVAGGVPCGEAGSRMIVAG